MMKSNKYPQRADMYWFQSIFLSFGMTTSGDKREVFNTYVQTCEQVTCVKEAAKISEGRVPSLFIQLPNIIQNAIDKPGRFGQDL